MNFQAGQRVEANISGTMPGLGEPCFTDGTIVDDSKAPRIYVVETDRKFNGNNRFPLEPYRLGLQPERRS
jgi:hypothetical protein